MKKWMAIAGSILFASSLNAYAITKPCIGCSNAEVNQLAWDSVTEMASKGPLYIVDLRNGVVRKFEYRNNQTPDWNPETDPFEQWAEETTVEPNISAGVAEIGGYMREASETEYITIPPNTPGMPSDVFDAIRESGMDDDINYWINVNSNAEYWNRAADRLESIGGTWFVPSGLRVFIRLQWTDGSYAFYGWNTVQQAFVRIPGTARDGQNNLIPEKKEDTVTKTYSFPTAANPESSSADDFYDMWNYIKDMGVPVIDARGGLGGYGYKMVCVSDICTIYIQAQ